MLENVLDRIIQPLQQLKAYQPFGGNGLRYIDECLPLLEPTVVKISALNPNDASLYPYSTFDEYNRFLDFDVALSIFAGNTAIRDIKGVLNALVTEETKKATFRFSQADALANSKSALPENSFRWPSLGAFGHYAYYEHLPTPSLGVNDIENPDDLAKHREHLRQVATQAYEHQTRLSQVIHQKWCGRYVLSNPGRSRRFAACAYLAKKGDLDFDQPFEIGIKTQEINTSKLAELDTIMDTYALFADNKYHKQLLDTIRLQDVPAGVFYPRWNREHLGHDLQIYFILKPEYLVKLIGRRKTYPDYLGFYEKSRIPLQEQFETLVKEGVSTRFDNVLRTIVNAWTPES